MGGNRGSPCRRQIADRLPAISRAQRRGYGLSVASGCPSWGLCLLDRRGRAQSAGAEKNLCVELKRLLDGLEQRAPTHGRRPRGIRVLLPKSTPTQELGRVVGRKPQDPQGPRSLCRGCTMARYVAVWGSQEEFKKQMAAGRLVPTSQDRAPPEQGSAWSCSSVLTDCTRSSAPNHERGSRPVCGRCAHLICRAPRRGHRRQRG